MQLPNSSTLPINALAACFNSTSATYKFYWFLAILQEVEKGNARPLKKDLFAGMIANAWYTVNYFHVSFGKLDMLQRAIENIKVIEALCVDDKPGKICHTLTASADKRTIKELQYFNQEVPWRFLSPWISPKNEKEVYSRSLGFQNNCPYALFEDCIEINPSWVPYLVQNAGILKAFCYWKLSLYLQKHNPNVPDIPNKLIKPPFRNGLAKQRLFWDIVLDELGYIECIYSRDKLTKGNYAVEHFIPHAFVSHDLMWNLIPACKSFNSAKSDKLPPLNIYFERFYQLQVTGLEIVKSKEPKNKLLEDYLSIYPDIYSIIANKDVAKQRFKEQLEPLITIAANNGFEFMRPENLTASNKKIAKQLFYVPEMI